MTRPSPIILGRVECVDVVDEPLCEGVRQCGTSELNRCTCGFRRCRAEPGRRAANDRPERTA